MQALRLLERAFDAAADTGRLVEVWWRDDDAVVIGPRLERMVALAERTGARVALAVIPADVHSHLLAWCEGRVDVVQHGAAHRNHQASGKKAELGDARPLEEIVEELVALRARLEGPSFVPVMVPPWNRMRPDLAAALRDAGYRGVSRFGEGEAFEPIRRVDTHIDPIAWRGDRSLAPDEALAAMVTRGLAVGGPIGLLTHHAVETDAVVDFVARFASLVARHPGAVWTDAARLFAS
ncbi:polysaccharide deacetylase family protein [Acuticoccus sediminis]|uniref:hypothetical protein n=1 Tax=Acuticoccus sediminis TaxID=2184697 RepID=UPI001CFE718F|nr:hypothetical protein [Acuticoccus sediminis]